MIELFFLVVELIVHPKWLFDFAKWRGTIGGRREFDQGVYINLIFYTLSLINLVRLCIWRTLSLNWIKSLVLCMITLFPRVIPAILLILWCSYLMSSVFESMAMKKSNNCGSFLRQNGYKVPIFWEGTKIWWNLRFWRYLKVRKSQKQISLF